MEDTGSTWTLFAHVGIYISTIGSLIPVGLGLFFTTCFGANLPD